MSADAVERSLRVPLAAQMWSGTPRDMERVVKMLREYESRLHEDLRSSHRSGREQRRASHLQQFSFMRDEEQRDREFDQKEEERLGELLRRCELTLTAKLRRYEDERKGAPEQVLNGIDLPADVRSLRVILTRPEGRYSTEHAIFVSFDSDGVEAVVRSDSEDWPRVVLGRLTDILRPQKPWYAFLGTARASLIGLLLVNLLAFGSATIAPAFGIHFPGLFTAVALILQLGVTVLVFTKKRVFPMFEYRDSDRSPVGARAIALLSSSLLYVVALVVPYVFPA